MARNMTKAIIPTPIPIFAPIEKRPDLLDEDVVFAGGEVELLMSLILCLMMWETST